MASSGAGNHVAWKIRRHCYHPAHHTRRHHRFLPNSQHWLERGAVSERSTDRLAPEKHFTARHFSNRSVRYSSYLDGWPAGLVWLALLCMVSRLQREQLRQALHRTVRGQGSVESISSLERKWHQLRGLRQCGSAGSVRQATERTTLRHLFSEGVRRQPVQRTGYLQGARHTASQAQFPA